MVLAAVRLTVLCSVSLLLVSCLGRDSGNTPTPTIDTSVVDFAVIERLQETDEVTVYISLRKSDVPLHEQPVEEARAHTATVQASVLSILSEEDFRLTHQFPITAGLGGYITMSGVEKLAVHPDVLRVELDTGGTLPLHKTP